MKTSVLVVAAHPDDEVLGCGGTIARLSLSRDVHILILGEGATARFDSRKEAGTESTSRLAVSALAAGSVLGARTVVVGTLPDNRFDEVSLLDIVKLVEKRIDEVRPETVYTHHPGDLNIDHRMTFEAVLTATRPVPGSGVRELYTFEIPSSTEWAFHQVQPAFRPNVFVDIGETLEQKLKAIACYDSEVRAYPHPRSLEALRIIAHRWGTVVGLGVAEAFELVRSVR